MGRRHRSHVLSSFDRHLEYRRALVGHHSVGVEQLERMSRFFTPARHNAKTFNASQANGVRASAFRKNRPARRHLSPTIYTITRDSGDYNLESAIN